MNNVIQWIKAPNEATLVMIGPGIYVAASAITKDKHFHTTPEESKAADEAFNYMFIALNQYPIMLAALQRIAEHDAKEANGCIDEWEEARSYREVVGIAQKALNIAS